MTTVTESITKTLGTGSGIDTKALVTSLVEAQFATKNSLYDKQSDTLTSQISSVAKLKAGITGFDTALKALVSGGTLTTQPSSSNTAVATVTLQKGGNATGLSGSLVVEQLARAQAATSNAAIAKTQAFRAGTLTVTLGTPIIVNGASTSTIPVPVAAGATIDQIAKAIGTATGLQTQLVSDNGGVRLSIKGATGAAQTFEITGADTDSSATGLSLSTLSVGAGATGMTIGSTAQDAIVTLDGARFSRSGNTIGDLLPGVDLKLTGTSTSPVTLGTTPPGTALANAVEDVVATFNELKSLIRDETNSQTGALRTDSAAAALNRALGGLTLTRLATSTTGGPQTLADLGVSTDTDKRDGSLKLDKAKLAAVLAKDPAGVEALFAVDANGKGGLSGAISTIATTAGDRTFGFDAATTRYTKAAGDVTAQKAKVAAAATEMTTRLTQQYAAMDARVAAYKATQTFMENQVKIWTKSN